MNQVISETNAAMAERAMLQAQQPSQVTKETLEIAAP